MRISKIYSRSVLPALLLFSLSLVAQTETHEGSIKGLVIDATTKQPLPFCNILLKNTETGGTSDESGRFHLEGVPEGKYSLTVSFIGYHEKTVSEIEVVRNKAAFVEIALSENLQALEGVEVVAYKYEDITSMPTGTYSLSREEIFRSPASNGNIFKAISVIPGVQSGGGSFSALAVRGQGTDQNAIFVDDFPIFELSHLAGGAGAGIAGGFDDPNGGRFSIFGPRVIDGLVIQTGGFSSLYGRKSSSYLGLNVKEGNPENAESDVLIALTGPALSYSGPSFGKKSTLFAALRYQNFVPALNLTKQGDLGSPSFSDLTLKNVTRLNENQKLTFMVLFNPEWFNRTTDNIEKDDDYENTLTVDANNSKGLLGIKLLSLLNTKSNWTNLIYTRFKTSSLQFGKGYPELDADGNLDGPIPVNNQKGNLDNTELEIGGRSIYTSKIKNRTTLKVGVDLARIQIDHNRNLTERDTIYSFYRSQMPADQQEQNFIVLEPEQFNSVYKSGANNLSAYANLEFMPLKNVFLNTGLRYDYTGFSDSGKLSPRFSLNYKLSEKSSINAAAGIFYQDPLFVDIADNNGKKLQPEKAVHYIAGFRHYFNSDLKFTSEVYYKEISDLIVRPNTTVNSLENNGTGYAYGLDISLVKRLSRNYNAQISYSYSQSKRDNHDGIGEYDHLYSQPHLFNFLLSYQLGDKFIFSGKFRYSTGQPTNSSTLFSNVFDDPEFFRYGQELTGRHDIRNDDFLGLDVRIDRKFRLGKNSLNMYVDVQNVLNRTNGAARTFFETTGNYEPQALGILPTIGWRLAF